MRLCCCRKQNHCLVTRFEKKNNQFLSHQENVKTQRVCQNLKYYMRNAYQFPQCVAVCNSMRCSYIKYKRAKFFLKNLNTISGDMFLPMYSAVWTMRSVICGVSCKGSSINYVISKSAIFDLPSPPETK